MMITDDVGDLVRMSAYEGSAAAAGLAALCSILRKNGVISSEDINQIKGVMRVTLMTDEDSDVALIQAKENVIQKFAWHGE
jgi:hypothetical protein